MNSLLEKKIEGFSNLSNEEGGKILEKYLLEGLESETLLEREMITKFLAYPYSEREQIRKVFNLAIKKNKQVIAQKTVGEWLKKYGMTYDGKERNNNTFFEFVRDNAETKTLSKRDRTRLMRIYRMYDYLLVDPIPGLDDTRMSILKFPMYLDEDTSRMPFDSKSITESTYTEEAPRKIVNITIAEALKNYPNLGEKSITVNNLKLKYFSNSVRPSIKNWITDFHDNMGAGKHGTVDRGNYLFHSENGKRLTPMERQKLSLLLKSLDEQTLLSIDEESQTIVFQGSKTTSSAPSLTQKNVLSNRNEPTVKNNIIPENNNLKNAIAIEDNYFQIPKSQPKADTASWKSKPALRSNNYSPNFKNNTESNFFSQQKKETTGQDNFKDFTAMGGKMSFSSPQRFSNEQQPKIQTNISKPDQWVAKPPVYSREETDIEKQPSQPKANKNIIDLRN